MGNNKSTVKEIADNPHRRVFVQYKKMAVVEGGILGSFVIFTYTLRYQRYRWEVNMRYSDLMSFQRQIARLHPDDITKIDKLSRRNKLFWTHDQAFLDQRAAAMAKYLQDVLDFHYMIDIPLVRALLASSSISFNPDFGRKGKEGWLKKCSGGYNEKFSMKTGDFIKIWKWRWIVLTDTCIVWYKNPNDTNAQGSLLIDQEFVVFQTGRVLSIRTGTRRFMFRASTTREAVEWSRELQSFYNQRPKAIRQSSNSSYPPRASNDVKVYTTGKDYFQSLAVALLSAQKEIMITSWKNSPGVLLTRPPLPPLRLDQILQYKAEQGIQIYVLLYKEVEHIGQGNDSMKVKRRLEGLSPNIHVIRHPNKFLGGATAVLWSHHEKLAIIDRYFIISLT
jgi:phospholipase D1/2